MGLWRVVRKGPGGDSSADGNCVELRSVEAGFQVRDSKLGDSSPFLGLTSVDLAGLLRKAG